MNQLKGRITGEINEFAVTTTAPFKYGSSSEVRVQLEGKITILLHCEQDPAFPQVGAYAVELTLNSVLLTSERGSYRLIT